MGCGEIIFQQGSDLANVWTTSNYSNMGYARWVHDSFRHVLVDASDKYLETNDRNSDKTRSKLINRICKEITIIANTNNESLPDELHKVYMFHPQFRLSEAYLKDIVGAYGSGLETPQPDMRRMLRQRNRKWTLVATRRPAGLGRPNLHANTSLLTAFPKSRRLYPKGATRILGSMAPPSLRFSQS